MSSAIIRALKAFEQDEGVEMDTSVVFPALPSKGILDDNARDVQSTGHML